MRRKSAALALLLGWIFSLSLIWGCGGGGGGGSSSTPASTPSTPQNVSDRGIVMGKVLDESGAQVGTVTVSLDGTSVTSNEQGFFTLERVTPGQGKVLAYSKDGYLPGSKVINVVAGQQTFSDLVMKRVGNRVQISSATNNTVTDSRGDGRNGSILIPANSVVDGSGNPVASPFVEITTLLPSDAGFRSLFPGSFRGGATAGSTANPQPLISYGVVNVDLKDAQGNKLFLASGSTATLTFPLDPNAANDPGDATVPLWYLDEASGIWIQEGTAARVGSTYVGNVTHLTPWNVDKLLQSAITKVVTVVDIDGNPVRHAYVILEGTGYRQVGYTGDAGTVNLIARSFDNIRVWAEKGTLKSVVNTELTGSAGTTLRNTVVLTPPLVTVTLTWGASPSDLDSHMTGPTGSLSRFHVYYSTDGTLTASPYCALDTDDVTSYGPEIVTVTKLYPGVYRYSVHNYSGQSGFRMENSGAVVNLVIPGSGIIRRYNIPTSNSANGNLWVVFEITVDSAGNITLADVNTFGTTDASGDNVQ